MRNHHAIDIALLDQRRDALAEGHQVIVGEALRGNLENLITTHLGNRLQLRNAGNELVDRHLGCLIGGAVGHIGTGTGDCATGGEDDDVRLVGSHCSAADYEHRDHGQQPTTQVHFKHGFLLCG